MNNNKIHEILENCLVEIEAGADIDTVLFRHPEYAEELRPILETSIKAMSMAAEPSIAMVQGNRAKLLQRAAQMRESKARPVTGFWFASLRRLAVTALILVMVFVSGTGLVRAASNTIPGDNLYPVKRTWEDILLLFTFNTQHREEMEFEHENERLEELNELFAAGRSIKVDFAGYVTHQSGNEWIVSGIRVILSPQTSLPNQPVAIGAAVRIVGMTQPDKTVLAEMIALLPSGVRLPEIENNSPGSEEENHEMQTPEVEHGSNSGSGSEGSGSETETPSVPATSVPATRTPKPEPTPREVSFEGMLESIDGNIWTISGQSVDVSSAEINGNPVIGTQVKVEGYLYSSGVVVAKHIEVVNGSNDSNSKSNDNGSPEPESDDSHHDDSSNSSSGGHG